MHTASRIVDNNKDPICPLTKFFFHFVIPKSCYQSHWLDIPLMNNISLLDKLLLTCTQIYTKKLLEKTLWGLMKIYTNWHWVTCHYFYLSLHFWKIKHTFSFSSLFFNLYLFFTIHNTWWWELNLTLFFNKNIFTLELLSK